MKTRIVALFVLLVASHLHAGERKSFAIAGDSWGALHCLFGSFALSFQENELGDVKINDCLKTTQFGARSERWLGLKASKKLMRTLAQNKTDVVFLSLGGNDFLYNWSKNMTSEEEMALFSEIVANTKRVVQAIVAASPRVKVLLSGYDYGNFVDFSHINSYRELYDDLGRPTPYELNMGIVRLSKMMSKIADQNRVFYIQHFGVSHYHLGHTKSGLAPHTTLRPELISSKENPNQIGGDPNLETPQAGMLRLEGLYYDAFHLSPRGYYYLADHSVSVYIKEWLK